MQIWRVVREKKVTIMCEVIISPIIIALILVIQAMLLGTAHRAKFEFSLIYHLMLLLQMEIALSKF